ncbi:Intracellular sulfur oxidation protein, DsrE/DsrF family [Kriegella aquimaris]|uniref:Intracellular sulfur oxidation protein, DsrE/DsrF family n=2 Tax=Kriegella aquimaris TaxID=192904 RepID=A0A1G9JEV3_9FLAO|nr:Intracellular sulfur oxidation protein, DsrE/DsrF family [Kriegella aquimaris]
MGSQMKAQEWETPVIDGYGKIKYFRDVAVQPDKALDYNLIFDIKTDKERDGVNEGLWKIARTLNMLGVSGIASEKIKIVAAVHGGATFFALNEQKHKEKYGKGNPNLELLKLLRSQGVELYVCSQATSAHDIEDKDLNNYVQPALSALSVLANYQLKGYVFMP